MSSPIAGWYADASNPSLLRYWDGQQWTEHTTPAPGAGQPGGAEGAQPGQAGQPQPQPGQGQAGQSAGYGAVLGGYASAPGGYQGSADDQSAQYAGQPAYAAGAPGPQGYLGAGMPPVGPGNPGPKRGPGVLIAVIGGAVGLVAVLIVLGFVVFGGGDDEPEPDSSPTATEPDETDSEEPTDDATEPDDEPTDDASNGPVDPTDVDRTLSFGDFYVERLDDDGNWVAEIDLVEDSTVILSIEDYENAGLTVSISDQAGTVLHENDGRGSDAAFLLASAESPLLIVHLPQGQYIAQVQSDGAGGGAEFLMTFNEPASIIEVGHEESIELPESAYIGRELQIDRGGQYTIEADGDGATMVIEVFGPDGEAVGSDPGGDPATASMDLEPGSYFVAIYDTAFDEVDLDFSVSD